MVLMNRRFGSLGCICSDLMIENCNYSQMSESDTQLNGFVEARSFAAYYNFSMGVVIFNNSCSRLSKFLVIRGLCKFKLQCNRRFDKYKILMH